MICPEYFYLEETLATCSHASLGKGMLSTGAVLVASLSPDSLRVEYTCPQEVISQKIPTLRNYSRSQCWL